MSNKKKIQHSFSSLNLSHQKHNCLESNSCFIIFRICINLLKFKNVFFLHVTEFLKKVKIKTNCNSCKQVVHLLSLSLICTDVFASGY